MPLLNPEKYSSGFTLAELLIALAILGVIATFTIPKILTSQQNAENAAKTKEAIATVSGAYQLAQSAGTVSSATKSADLTPYINYVSVDAASTIDGTATATVSCATRTCLRLHNGGTLGLLNNESFSGTGTTNGVWFVFDPDGTANSSKGVGFFLFYNGRLSSFGSAGSCPTQSSIATYAVCQSDASWFSW